jgi:hypothetical protein
MHKMEVQDEVSWMYSQLTAFTAYLFICEWLDLKLLPDTEFWQEGILFVD